MAVPPKPSTPTLVAGNGQLEISVGAISASPAVFKWEVQLDGGNWQNVGPGHHNAGFTVVLHGLSNGHTYSVVARASNLSGTGPASDAATATPHTVPEKPDNFTVARRDQAGLVLAAFLLSADLDNNGGAAVTGWQYRYKPAHGSWTSWTAVVATWVENTGLYGWNGLTNRISVALAAYDAMTTGNLIQFTETKGGVGLVVGRTYYVSKVARRASDNPANGQIVLYHDANRTSVVDLGAFPSDNSAVKWRYGTASAGNSYDDFELTGLLSRTQYTLETRAVNVAGAGAAAHAGSSFPEAQYLGDFIDPVILGRRRRKREAA